MVSIADEKIPIDTRIPSIVNMRKPMEANANFISFIFVSDSNEIILMSIDKPRNENRRNISSSFMYWPSFVLHVFRYICLFWSGVEEKKREGRMI
jgi:hypothetical protein